MMATFTSCHFYCDCIYDILLADFETSFLHMFTCFEPITTCSGWREIIECKTGRTLTRARSSSYVIHLRSLRTLEGGAAGRSVGFVLSRIEREISSLCVYPARARSLVLFVDCRLGGETCLVEFGWTPQRRWWETRTTNIRRQTGRGGVVLASTRICFMYSITRQCHLSAALIEA